VSRESAILFWKMRISGRDNSHVKGTKIFHVRGASKASDQQHLTNLARSVREVARIHHGCEQTDFVQNTRSWSGILKNDFGHYFETVWKCFWLLWFRFTTQILGKFPVNVSQSARDVKKVRSLWWSGNIARCIREGRLNHVCSHICPVPWPIPDWQSLETFGRGKIGDWYGWDWKWSNIHLSRDHVRGAFPFWQGRATFGRERNEIILWSDRVTIEGITSRSCAIECLYHCLGEIDLWIINAYELSMIPKDMARLPPPRRR
jgi:hypothetical protein